VAEVEAWIHKVLGLGVNLNPGRSPGHVPLWRGIASVMVSTSSPVLAVFVILSFHYTHDLA
jgi:hypothetical protein